MPRAPKVELVDEAVLDGPAVKEPNRRRARRLLILLAPFAALTLFMAVSAMTGSSARQGVIDAAEKWADRGPDSYELTYLVSIDDQPVGAATVSVEDGILTGYETADPALEDRTIYTVEATFFRIEEVARADDDAVLNVTYDAEYGHATEVTLDLEPGNPGGEWSLEVLAFDGR
ncbi:MAG: DUF6174 domain-containing protein [Actinomycetota bacterium]